jgi:FkbM family methyltransferase
MYYGQNKEDEIILDYFFNKSEKHATDRNYINVLDIGANDGITFSNSFALFDIGAKGVCVEPSPTAFTKLCRLHAKREGVYCYEKAVGSRNGKVTLYDSGTHLGAGDTSLVSTIKESELSRWTNEKFTPVEVDCVTFETLLSLCPIKQFDFITIDIEGLEKEVLPQLDLNKLGCKLLCIEWNGKDFDFFNDYITKFGHKLIHQNNENLIYAL